MGDVYWALRHWANFRRNREFHVTGCICRGSGRIFAVRGNS